MRTFLPSLVLQGKLLTTVSRGCIQQASAKPATAPEKKSVVLVLAWGHLRTGSGVFSGAFDLDIYGVMTGSCWIWAGWPRTMSVWRRRTGDETCDETLYISSGPFRA
jgi:hypothetical protein